MTDPKALAEHNETPEDVASLYSWANLHGAKYRDFSASRAQMRERARMRVQQAIEGECVPDKAEPVVVEPAQEAPYRTVRANETASPRSRATPMPLPQGKAPSNYTPTTNDFPLNGVSPAPNNGPSTSYAAAPPQGSPSQDRNQTLRPAPVAQSDPSRDTLREERDTLPRNPWLALEPRETLGRPAWLASEQIAPIPPAPEDTIQGSRDQLASRWYALQGLFGAPAAPLKSTPPPIHDSASVPVLAVFSLAGGVGKTSLVATLGRALSAHGERVLLVDTAAYGLLPFYFGARDLRPGVLRTFTSPGNNGDVPIQTIALDPEALGADKPSHETLTSQLLRLSQGANRVLVDLATASVATAQRVLRLNPTILAPVLPDMSSVMSVRSIDSFFELRASVAGRPVQPFYVLNNFDPSLPLHLDVREVLRQRLGDRLLPFALRRAPAMSEALAEGMTAMDYAPHSPIAEDFANLAEWVKSLPAQAGSGTRRARWSER